MNISRLVTGIVLILFGLFLFVLAFFINGGMSEGIWVWIYGIPIFVIGLFILFNTREDKIEGRKDLKGNKFI